MLRRTAVLLQEASHQLRQGSRLSPAAEFDFIPATSSDLPRILDIAKHDFIKTEPHSIALGLTAEGMHGILEWIIAKSLHYPHSYVITEKGSDKAIGFRLMSIGYRKPEDNWEPFELEITDPKTMILGEILEGTKDLFWEIKKDVNKVLRREITFVTRRHQRKGIAQHLLHLGLDFELLKASGMEGIVSEASSIANQSLLDRNGYLHLADAPKKSYVDENGQPLFKFDDETQVVKLMYKPLQ